MSVENLIDKWKAGTELEVHTIKQCKCSTCCQHDADRLARIAEVLWRAVRSHSAACEDGAPLGWEAEAMAEAERIGTG